ncbi:MAG: penicillin-binding protein 2 [Proteobacteria bacterium]|nr:penicillin-binding protein 2 [Pseudomonadota bacterium]
MMDDILEQRFQRRTLILAGLKGSLLFGLIGRLFHLQILQKNHFKNLSDKNRIHNFLIIPDRGNIFDQKGILLAHSNNEYFGLIDRENVENIDDLIEHLLKIIDLSDKEIKIIRSQFKKRKSLEPIIFKENLNIKDMCKLEVHLPELPGVRCEKIRMRYYPDPLPFSHVLGFVGSVSEKEKKNNKNPLLMLPEFKIGKTGLEKKFDSILQGQGGARQVEINAYRKIIRTLSIQESKMGQSLNLTIDFDLQKKIYELLEPHQSGACALMDVHTGALKAFVSYPGFDTNLFLHRVYKNTWKELHDSPYRPLINKMISGQYAPGSTFKMIVALTALEKKIITPSDCFTCEGHLEYKNHKFHCWKWQYGGHGAVNVEQAIASSCDVFFYNLALRLDIDDISDMAKRFGLSIETEIELLYEKKGLMPTKEWKLKRYKKKWHTGDTINASIGQGYLLATPIQLCRMISCLANGGRLIKPHLVKNDVPESRVIDIHPDHLKIVLNGMTQAVNKPFGTSYNVRSLDKAYQFSGKTGSTQVSRISEQDRIDKTHNKRPWHLKEHAFFVGYGPSENPKYGICVFIEHGGSGGKIAAPLARDILLAAEELLK